LDEHIISLRTLDVTTEMIPANKLSLTAYIANNYYIQLTIHAIY